MVFTGILEMLLKYGKLELKTYQEALALYTRELRHATPGLLARTLLDHTALSVMSSLQQTVTLLALLYRSTAPAAVL